MLLSSRGKEKLHCDQARSTSKIHIKLEPKGNIWVALDSKSNCLYLRTY